MVVQTRPHSQEPCRSAGRDEREVELRIRTLPAVGHPIGRVLAEALVSTVDVSVSDAILTGESRPVHKAADAALRLLREHFPQTVQA